MRAGLQCPGGGERGADHSSRWSDSRGQRCAATGADATVRSSARATSRSSKNVSHMPLAGLCPGGRCPRRAEERRPAAGPRRPAAERPLGAVRRQRPSAAVAATARGSWRCSNSLLKRREAREARERKARRVWAAACRLHLSMPAKDRSVAGTRGGIPWPLASPATAATLSGSASRARASCEGVRDAVGSTWSIRDRAASTRCPGGSPSRG